MKTKIQYFSCLTFLLSIVAGTIIAQAFASGGGIIGPGGCPGCTETPPPPPLIEKPPVEPIKLFIVPLPCSGEPEIYYYCPNIPGDKELCEENLSCSQDSCEPELGNPSCVSSVKAEQYFYCGNLTAINGQSQDKCLNANNAKQGDVCIRNDQLCMYIRINSPTTAPTITIPTPKPTSTTSAPRNPISTPTNPTPNPINSNSTPTSTVPTTTDTNSLPTNPTLNPVNTVPTPTDITPSPSNSDPTSTNTNPTATNTNSTPTDTNPIELEARSEIENWLQSLSQDTVVDPVYNKAICGNSSLEEGENCDDGENNGKNGYCSLDCLYQNEVSPLSSSSINNSGIGTKDKSPVLGGLQNITHFVNQSVSTLKRVLGTSTNKIGQSIKKAQNDVVNIVQSNVSPETFNTIKQIAAAAKEISKYTVIGATTLLGTTAAALNVMVYRAHWSSYTIQPGDTIESIGNQFTMTERSMLKKNGLQKGSFKPGQKIKVRNRHFLEKDYLDQLKFVLKDTLEKRNLGKMSAKIDQLFARK